MSGITGIYHFDGRPAEQQLIVDMTDRLAHRGTDGTNVWCAGALGLGNRMLWTTPESRHERLPLSDTAGRLVLAADARIDNREDLLAALELRSDTEHVVTDSELILAAYMRWGEHCAERLIGDFAFAIWDGRSQTLFCARDPMGVKPFYYYRSSKFFALASEIKALFAVPEIPRELNEVRIAELLVRSFGDGAMTLYQGVLALPAHHCLVVSPSGVRSWSYWTLDHIKEIRLHSEDDYAAGFREVFTEAVRCRLRSAYPVGALLSGGLDSSSIVTVARRIMAQEGRGPLHTISAIFPDLPEEYRQLVDERPCIEAVIAEGGVQPHYLQADRLNPLMHLRELLRLEDGGFFGPNLYLHRAFYDVAHGQGVRVLLDGVDGDTVVSHGLQYLQELARQRRWGALLDEAGAFAGQYHLSRKDVIWQHAVSPLLPEYLRRFWRWIRGRSRPVWGPYSVIDAQFARRTGLARRIQELAAPAQAARTSREQHWYALNSALFPYGLELADRMAGPFSVEPRYPFFDRRVIEFCTGVPAAHKLHKGWTRYIERRAMEGLLPTQVQWRRQKAHLGANLLYHLSGPERKALEQVVYEEPHTLRRYIDVAALRSVYRRYVAQPRMHIEDGVTVLTILNLSLWLKQEQGSV